MDIVVLVGIMGFVYGAMIFAYYYIRVSEKQERISTIMMDGITSMHRGNLDKALICFDKAYRYSFDVDDKEQMATALYNIGIIYKKQGEIDKALRYLEEASRTYTKIQDREGRTRAMLAIDSIRKS